MCCSFATHRALANMFNCDTTLKLELIIGTKQSIRILIQQKQSQGDREQITSSIQQI